MLVEALSRVALLGSEWVLYVLLVLSLVSVGAMFERWRFFRSNARSAGPALRRALESAVKAGDPDAIRAAVAGTASVESRVLGYAVDWLHGGPAAVSSALESSLGEERTALERSTTLLGTIGNNAPFIGLFGTVIGVIEAFHYLGVGGAAGSAMGKVMAGIAEALVATGVGIFVAIPAVVAFNVAQKKIADIENNAGALGKLIIAWLETNQHEQAPRARVPLTAIDGEREVGPSAAQAARRG